MLIIFKLQLTFTDFESSGENIDTEAMFLQNLKNLFFETFWNIFVTVRVWRRMYIDKAKEPQTLKILPQDEYFSKKV